MGKEEFCKLLQKAIKDEEEAPEDYEKLLNSFMGSPLQTNVITQMIKKIIKDEKEHYQDVLAINLDICK